MLIHVAETPDLRRTRKKVTSLVLRAGNLNFLAVSVPKGGLTSLPCGNPLRPGGLGFLKVFKPPNIREQKVGKMAPPHCGGRASPLLTRRHATEHTTS